MLPQFFLDWWFMPWNYMIDAPRLMQLAVDDAGRRDGYRLWCRRVGIAPEFPMKFDPSWSDAVTVDGEHLTATARLFAGLIAVREQDEAALAVLPSADRKWCVSIAATQPLRRSRQAAYREDESMEMRGLLELALHLEHGFPGLWSRLRLTLVSAAASRVDILLHAAQADEDMHALARRAQRCWRMCNGRVEMKEGAYSPRTMSSDATSQHTRQNNRMALLE